MARKKSEESVDPNSWMNTYSDMVTLLLCFFAVLMSMSSTSEAKFEALVNSLKMQGADIIAVDPPGDAASQEEIVQGSIDDLYAYLKQFIDENGKGDQISVAKDKDMVFIRFQNDMFFEPDKYVLRADSVEGVNFIAKGLKQFESAIRTINVCGHTADTDRVNSQISDWRLSGERAATIAMVVEDEGGVPASKIQVTGYGKNYPVASNDTEEGRRLNRRVEIIVIGQESKTQTDMYSAIGQYGGEKEQGGLDTLLGEDGEPDAAPAAPTTPAATPAATPTSPPATTADAPVATPPAPPPTTTDVGATGRTNAQAGGVEQNVSPYAG